MIGNERDERDFRELMGSGLGGWGVSSHVGMLRQGARGSLSCSRSVSFRSTDLNRLPPDAGRHDVRPPPSLPSIPPSSPFPLHTQLVRRSYQLELFLAVIGGLVIGHALFNISAPVTSGDPCCQARITPSPQLSYHTTPTLQLRNPCHPHPCAHYPSARCLSISSKPLLSPLV